MQRFFPGDFVTVNGKAAKIEGWPADNTGPFVYEVLETGSPYKTTAVGMASVNADEGPVQGAADVRLVRRAG